MDEYENERLLGITELHRNVFTNYKQLYCGIKPRSDKNIVRYQAVAQDGNSYTMMGVETLDVIKKVARATSLEIQDKVLVCLTHNDGDYYATKKCIMEKIEEYNEIMSQEELEAEGDNTIIEVPEEIELQ